GAVRSALRACPNTAEPRWVLSRIGTTIGTKARFWRPNGCATPQGLSVYHVAPENHSDKHQDICRNGPQGCRNRPHTRTRPPFLAFAAVLARIPPWTPGVPAAPDAALPEQGTRDHAG